jgi:phosphotransferase system  glucose/maltose/N-acetylglucosamine-specific IIC component
MKKSTWHFLAAALACIPAAIAALVANRMFRETIPIVFEKAPLPVLTSWVMRCSWWPHVFIVLPVLGLVLSRITKNRDDFLCSAALALALLGFIASSLTTLGYAVLFYSPTWTLSP